MSAAPLGISLEVELPADGTNQREVTFTEPARMATCGLYKRCLASPCRQTCTAVTMRN